MVAGETLVIVGCYSLDLYCDAEGCTTPRPHLGDRSCGPHAEYTHELGAECRRRARKAGWVLNVREGTAVCPTCAARGAKAVVTPRELATYAPGEEVIGEPAKGGTGGHQDG